MHGGAEIHYLTKQPFRGLLESNPHVSKVFAIEKSTNEVVDALKQESYDYIIDLHHNLRSARVKRALKSLSFSFKKYNLEKWLLVNFRINRMPNVHIVDRYMETVKAFGIVNDGEGLDYFFPENFEPPVGDLPETHQNGFIGIVIGAAHWRKKPSLNQYVRICKELHYPVVLLGGPNEKAEGAEIVARTPAIVWNTAGQYNLNGSAWLVRESQLVITPDTGLMHIAAAMRKPIVSLWTATVPDFGMTPYRNKALCAIIQAEHLKKRPCSKLGTRCKYEVCRCIDELPIDEAISLSRREVQLR